MLYNILGYAIVAFEVAQGNAPQCQRENVRFCLSLPSELTVVLAMALQPHLVQLFLRHWGQDDILHTCGIYTLAVLILEDASGGRKRIEAAIRDLTAEAPE